MTDDIALLERISAGDSDAFDELVRKYQREIYFLALRMVKNPEDAEELSQQVFVKAFQNLKSFERRASFRTWLYQVAINQCKTFIRRRKPVVELDEHIAAKHDDEPGALNRLIADETTAGVAAMVEALPERQRMVVTLRVYHEMSYREIGESLGCSEETAKVNFHYAIENIRKRMM